MSKAPHQDAFPRKGFRFVDRCRKTLEKLRPQIAVKSAPEALRPALPDRPAIAVLPCENMTTIPNGVFCGRNVEELITPRLFAYTPLQCCS